MNGDWISQPQLPEVFRCDDVDCPNPTVSYLFHENNGAIYKCCSGCWRAGRSVKRKDFLSLIKGNYSEFQSTRSEHWKKIFIERSKQKEAEWAAKASANEDFFRSSEWRHLRLQALFRDGRCCRYCGRAPPEVVLHVDHKRPRSKYPELALTLSNLQVLCEDCNIGKSNRELPDGAA